MPTPAAPAGTKIPDAVDPELQAAIDETFGDMVEASNAPDPDADVKTKDETPAPQKTEEQELAEIEAAAAAEGAEGEAKETVEAKEGEEKTEAKKTEEPEKEPEGELPSGKLLAIQRAAKRAEEQLQAKQKAWEDERNAQAREFEQAVASFKEHVEKFNAERGSTAELERLAVRDPIAFYKKLGVKSFADVAKVLYYAEVGDENAPAELKAHKAQYARDREMDELRQRLDKSEREREQALNESRRQQSVQRYQSDLDAAVKTANAPFVAKAAAKNSALVLREMFELADGIARRENYIPKPEEVVAFYEKTLADRAELLGLGAAPAASVTGGTTQQPAAGKTTTATGKTLNNNLNSPTPKRREEPAEDDHEARWKRAMEALERGDTAR